MKENDNYEEREEKLINEKEKALPSLEYKESLESNVDSFDDSEKNKEEKTKEIHNSYFYNLKDYLLFFCLVISSSMNFSYLYYPLTIIGIISNYLIGKNSIITKSYKSLLELISIIYSSLLLLFKIFCLILIKNNNSFISKNEEFFLNLGICYLRKNSSSFYFIMSFLGESIVILFSFISIIISRKYYSFSRENDTSLMKNNFWTSRKLIILNFIFILSFTAFNQSFLTLFYMNMLQILFFLSSININQDILDKLSKTVFVILKYCLLLQILFINILNVPKFQENILHKDDIIDKEGNKKVFSIFTKIGINYSYNEKISYVWKEWIGYLITILSLISLTYSLNNTRVKELELINKISSMDLLEAKNLLYENIEKEAKNNPKNKTKIIKSKMSKGISRVKNIFEAVITFITSPALIIQFCRVMSIFYIYIYPNFFSIGIFISLFFSSIFLDVKKNKNLTLFLLAPMVLITTNLFHISNINGLFENFSDIRRRKYLNFALGKYEYSFLEYYGHNLFFIFTMFLIYSFYANSGKYNEDEETIIVNYISLNDTIEEPLLRNSLQTGKDNIIIQKEEYYLNVKNLLLKFIFTYIDLITLIAMYFVAMDSINLVHLVLVIIFLIQIIFPHKIQKMYKIIICILQILFFIELFIHLLKAYFFENFNNSKDAMNFILIYTDKITGNNIELSIYLVIYCFYFQYQLDNFPYIKHIINNKSISLENYIERKFEKLTKTKYFLYILGNIISNLYIWLLIGLFFTFSCYFEINFIFAIKLGYFIFLTFNILLKIQNKNNENQENKDKEIPSFEKIFIDEIKSESDNNELEINTNSIKVDEEHLINDKDILIPEQEDLNKKIGKDHIKYKFSYSLYYTFLVFCSLNSLLVYLYQFVNNNLISSKIESSSSDSFFIKNLPNIGFSIYSKDNLYLNFLPHFGITFISVLFISEIKRYIKKLNINKYETLIETNAMKENKKEIKKKLADKNISEFNKELLKSDLYDENNKIIQNLSIKYFFMNLIKIFSEFYWLFLFLSFGMIFSYYDLSFSLIIYIILFSIFFIMNFYRRITKLTKYINKPKGTYFISKVIRYTIVERPKSEELNKYYRSLTFKFLLSYNYIVILIIYLYGIFDLFQHGCNDSFFKGCEKRNKPIFEPDGTIENYLKAFAYLFGVYVDIRNEGLIEVAWVHILLSLLIGFDIYSQKILNKCTFECIYIRENILNIYNENNILYDFSFYKDTNISINICLKNAGVTFEEEVAKMEEEYKKRYPEENENEIKNEKDKVKVEKENKEEIKNNNEELKGLNEKQIKLEQKESIKDILENNPFLENKVLKKFLTIFLDSNDNKQILSKTNNNSTKLIWFLKKVFEEIIIVLLICIALTKLNILSFLYFIYFAYLTITKKTMLKFYILYSIIIILLIIQSIIYITNISEETCPKHHSNLLLILKDKLNIPWYINRYNIEKKYAFFYGLGVNKDQLGLLILEYIIIIALYIYLDFFSFSIYQDVKNKGEKEPAESKFNIENLKIDDEQKQEIKDMKQEFKECLKYNFNVNIKGDILDDKEENSQKEDSNFEPKMSFTNDTFDMLIYGKVKVLKEIEERQKKNKNCIPDSDFIKGFQEFIYLYLHIFFLFFIIMISMVIPGLISTFYLIICFYYLINSHKIYLGLKYGYPKQIKKLIKIILIIDLVLQLIYQIPYISSDNDIFYKIFNALGFSKLLNYLENSNVEFSTTSIIEIIGKPLIYLIISLQTIIYNSNDFKKYYIMFLLSLETKIEENGFIYSYIFNNSRINEFKNSINLRINNEIAMFKIKNYFYDWTKRLKNDENNIYEKPKIEPLKFIKEKEEEKKNELDKDRLEESKEVLFENKEEGNTLLNNIKSEGVIPLVKEVYEKKYSDKVDSDEILERLSKILLKGKLIEFYLWFNSKSIYPKSMSGNEKINYKLESFIGKKNIRSFIDNQVLDNLKWLDLSNFNRKELEVLEDFAIKYKNGIIKGEIEKIKNEIRKLKIEKILMNRENNINTILNNNNIINDKEEININEKELEKIDIEYKIKRGETEININTKKFLQFYYLLDTKFLNYYLTKTFLFKEIIKKLKSFIGNNFDYFAYIIMIINHTINHSLLSMFYPLSIFCFALLENPRPKKLYWELCLYYNILILAAKFLFQLKLFNSIMEPETYANFVETLDNYKIGIKYFKEGFGLYFFNYIFLDSFLLLILTLNKNILISNGLWDKREEQIENIFLASERHERFKGLPSINEQDQGGILTQSRIYDFYINKPETKEDQIKKEKSIFFKIISRLYFYNKLKGEYKYDEGNKSYFDKLFPKIRNEKPGTDKYPFLAFSMSIIIIYILLFFTQMVQDTNYGPVSLNTTQFSGDMVLFLIVHIVILVYDRIIYISQNKTELKFKYFIYKKNEHHIGCKISKDEYNKIKEDYLYIDEKHCHFPPRIIQNLQNNNYNLFYIQTEKFNKPLLQKYILHIFTTLLCHGFAFLYFPMVGNYNSLNTVYCNEKDYKLCNDFNNNIYIIFFYLIYLTYLFFSSVQIRMGYYDIRRKSLFKRNTKLTNIISKIFNAIPFLPQIRYAIDWTFTKTCFDIFQWIKFESIYDSIFDAYADSNEDDDTPIGELVKKKKKIGIGCSLSFVLIFILILPLILFSSLNPTNKLNNLIAAKINVDLSFTYGNDVELNYNLFENSKAKSISDMFKNGDSDWKKYKYDESMQTRNFNHEQIQIIKFSETSERNWDLAEPNILDLIELLNITNNKGLKSIKLKIQTQFERNLPAESQTVTYNSDIEIYSSTMDPKTSEGAKKIADLKNALENCSDVSINIEEGFISPLRFTAGNDVKEIKDKKYILPKNIQLGFQGCLKGQLILPNQIKMENTYLKSYFTFKSKDPEETNYSGAEFHAFNDEISESISGYSVVTFYLTFILVAGTYIADFLASEPEKIMFTDLPHPEKIVDICEGIKISRYSHDFKQEEELYTILIELMRSPDYLKSLTQSSLANFQIRKQKGLGEKEENDENKIENEKNEEDKDDEDDNDYSDADDEKNKKSNKDEDQKQKESLENPENQ